MKNQIKTEFYVGQDVECLMRGPGKIHNVQVTEHDRSLGIAFENFPIGLIFYTLDGRSEVGCLVTLFPRDTVEVVRKSASVEPEFKPTQFVLVSESFGVKWRLKNFSRHFEPKGEKVYVTTDDRAWSFCLPFEGNEHLLNQVMRSDHLV